MYTSSLKKFPCLGGSKGGGVSASQTQSYSKLPEMDRSSLKKFPPVWGGLFCQLNAKLLKIALNAYIQSKNVFPVEGGGFSAKSQLMREISVCEVTLCTSHEALLFAMVSSLIYFKHMLTGVT